MIKQVRIPTNNVTVLGRSTSDFIKICSMVQELPHAQKITDGPADEKKELNALQRCESAKTM
jgi:hypothetical protein